MTFLVCASPPDFKVVPILPTDSSHGGVRVSIHGLANKKGLGGERSPPGLVVNIHLVGGVTLIFSVFAGLPVDEDVRYGFETSFPKSVVPKAFACKESAHVLVVRDSVLVVRLIIGREYIV